MTFEKLKAKEPLFDSWYVESKLAEGKASKFYKVCKTENGELRHMGLKTVKFPSSEQEISAVIASGRFTNIDEYLNVLQNEITKNMQTMISLRSNKNIVRFDNFTIVRESSCFYVLMLMELLTPLASHLSLDSASVSDVIHLGQDICGALDGFRQEGIIHHDIKSENIYVDSFGNYKLGDFGIFDSIFRNANDPSTCIAPELYNKTVTSDTTSDIYSLGMLLYKLLNHNRMPFLPEFPDPVSLADREDAFMKCMRGDLLPAPKNAGYELASIIYKATSFRPTDRYLTPSLFAAELHRYSLSPELNAIAGVPFNSPLNTDTGTFEIDENSHVHFDSYEAPEEYDSFEEDFPEEEHKAGKHWYFIILALVVVLALMVALIAGGGKDKNKDKTTAPPPTQPTYEQTTTEETTTQEETTEEETTEEETTEETTTEETTTEVTTTEVTTTEETTTEVTTTEPLTAPTLVTTDKKNGGKSEDGRTYLKISSFELTQIPEDEFFTQVVLTIEDNLGEAPEGTTAYIYQMAGASVIQKVSAIIECETDEETGNIICTVTVEDSDFYYEPQDFQYYLCFEEGAIISDTVITLPLQVRVK